MEDILMLTNILLIGLFVLLFENNILKSIVVKIDGKNVLWNFKCEKNKQLDGNK